MDRMNKVVAVACLLLVACATARPPQLVPAAVLAAEPASAPRIELAPPSAVEPVPAPRPRKYYAAPMVALDLLVFISVVPVMQMIDERSVESDNPVTAAGSLYLGAYLFGGPLIHNAYGNGRQSGSSFLKRIGYPVLGGIGGGMLGRVLEGDCSGEEFCGIGTAFGVVLGAGVGVVVAVIHDWTKAHND
jgi:hypothetical protein